MPESNTEQFRRTAVRLAILLIVVALVIVAYWTAWATHRSLVASSTGVSYVVFEDAFPLADGWLALCLVLAAIALVQVRPTAMLWLLLGGGAGVYLFCMDVLYDLQHGVWAKGGNGLVELAINLATIGISLPLIRWTWLHRRELDPPEAHPSPLQ